MKKTTFKILLRRLYIRIPLQLILLLTSIIAAVAVIAVCILNNSTLNRARDTLSGITKSNATLASEFFLGVDTKAKTLAQTFNILRTDARSAWQAEDSIEKLLRETLKEERVFSAYAAFEPDLFLPATPKGLSICVSRNADREMTEVFNNFAVYGVAEGYLACQAAKAPHITEPYEYQGKNDETALLVSVYAPILDADGNFLGVVALDVLAGSIDALHYDDGGYTSSYGYLLTSKGAYLAHTKDKALPGVSLLESGDTGAQEIADAALSGKEVLFDQYTDAGGEPLYIFVHSMEIPGVGENIASVLVVQQKEPAAQILREFRSMPWLLLGVVICFGVGVSLLLKRALSPIGKIVRFSGQLMEGELDGELSVRTNDELTDLCTAVVGIRDTVRVLLEETGALTQAAAEGMLLVRADATRHKGAYRALVEGTNNTLQALTEPVMQVNRILYALSLGNISERLTGKYDGEFASIQQSLNGAMETIGGYIEEISRTLQSVSEGDLTRKITREYAGEFAALRQSINQITYSMSDVVSRISIAAEQVAEGTRQVSQGSQSVSEGAAEQAGAISELIAVMAQIAAQTGENAVRAGSADALSLAAIKSAEKGDGKMKSTQAAMQEISEACGEISRIIKAVDEIAFQTNLLALNAAVEAAHAGRYGRGFAVVAEEVRNLSARSAQAAQETADRIEKAVQKAQAGSNSLCSTAEALSEIVRNIQQEGELIGRISQASGEQAAGIAQVERSIEQLSHVVQANSATAVEAAAASEELSGQAELLRELVGQFRLNAEEMDAKAGNMDAKSGEMDAEAEDLDTEAEEQCAGEEPEIAS